MVTRRIVDTYYLARARELLERYKPGGHIALKPGDAVLLTYMWTYPPCERSAASRIVAADVDFGTAMLSLFARLDLLPLDVEYIMTLEMEAATTLAASLNVELVSLAPALHAVLLTMVEGTSGGANLAQHSEYRN